MASTSSKPDEQILCSKLSKLGHSDIFAHHKDKNQSEMIYEAINTVPELTDCKYYIKQYIGPYAVGTIYICASCKQGINICHEDIYNYNNQFLGNAPLTMISPIKFDIDHCLDVIYCSSCSDKITDSARGCNKRGLLDPSRVNSKCYDCNNLIHDGCQSSSKCRICNAAMFCGDCNEAGIRYNNKCWNCNVILCDKCKVIFGEHGQCIACKYCYVNRVVKCNECGSADTVGWSLRTASKSNNKWICMNCEKSGKSIHSACKSCDK